MTPDVARFWWAVGQVFHAAEQAWIAREMERARRRYG